MRMKPPQPDFYTKIRDKEKHSKKKIIFMENQKTKKKKVEPKLILRWTWIEHELNLNWAWIEPEFNQNWNGNGRISTPQARQKLSIAQSKDTCQIYIVWPSLALKNGAQTPTMMSLDLKMEASGCELEMSPL